MGQEKKVFDRTVAEAIRQAKLLFAPKRGNASTTGNASPSQAGLVPPCPATATKFLNGAAPPAFAQVKGSDLSMSDVLTNNVSTAAHGFAPKAPNDTTKFLRGDATWAVPAGGGGTTLGFPGPLMGRMTFAFAPIGSAVSNWSVTGDGSTQVGTAGGSGGTAEIGVTATGLQGFQGNTGYQFNHAPYFKSAITFGSSVANTRLWFGMTDQTATTMSGSANPAGSYAAFRYDTSAGDTHLQCVTKDGTTQTIVDSGITPVVGTRYRLAIDMDYDNSQVLFYIEGVLVATITTHLPAAATALRWVQVGNILSGSLQLVYGSLYVIGRKL